MMSVNPCLMSWCPDSVASLYSSVTEEMPLQQRHGGPPNHRPLLCSKLWIRHAMHTPKQMTSLFQEMFFYAVVVHGD